MPVILHAGHAVTWSAWHLDASIIAGVFVVAGLYVYSLQFSPRFEWWRPAAFFAGAALMFLALASPMDAAAHDLLSMHMLQHIVLTTFGPPLVLLGLPSAALGHFLPMGTRRFAFARQLTAPFVAGPIFILNMWLWHVPPVYEAALTNLGVHIAMHVAFMATGLLFWWPIVAPLKELSIAGGPARLLYLFVTGFPMGILALLLLSSETVIYDFYQTQPRQLWGVSPLADQQVAGVIMGSLGEAASFIAFSLIFVKYLLDSEAEPGPPERATPVKRSA